MIRMINANMIILHKLILHQLFVCNRLSVSVYYFNIPHIYWLDTNVGESSRLNVLLIFKGKWVDSSVYWIIKL